MVTNGNSDANANRTLVVRYREGDDEALERTLKALDRGERPDPFFEVVYRDPEDVHLVTRPKNLELLGTIVQHEPRSIRETARLVDRDVRQVHRNLTELSDLHLIELVEDGQAKRPHVWYDAIELDLPLVESTNRDDGVKA